MESREITAMTWRLDQLCARMRDWAGVILALRDKLDGARRAGNLLQTVQELNQYEAGYVAMSVALSSLVAMRSGLINGSLCDDTGDEVCV